MTLIASSPTKERLLEQAKKYFYSNNIVFNDDGSVSNKNGVISGVKHKQKGNRYRLERGQNE